LSDRPARDFGFASDGDEFLERLEKLVPFAAQMRDVNPAVACRHLAERDEFIRFGVKRRGVDER